MTRLSKMVLVLAIGAFGTTSGAIGQAEDTDKAGRVKVKMPRAQAVEVRGWDPEVKTPADAPAGDDDSAVGDAQAPPAAMTTPGKKSKVLRLPVAKED